MSANHGTVAIVGRPNVGKSALFNRLAGRMISIVHDQPGVTRDRITAICKLGEKPFAVVDTGGIGSPLDDGFSEAVRTEADLAIDVADVILLVVDGRDGLTPVDQDLAKTLRRSRKPVVLVVNKIDHSRLEANSGDFAKLGFPDIYNISAAHGIGIPTLIEHIDTLLPETPVSLAAESAPVSIAVVGRPNVGKSSLINAILEDKRTIVSDVAGTTRDAVDVPYTHDGKPYVLIDTAGIRHRSRHDTSVEVFSVMRSEKSIRRADLCVLVIDGSSGVTSQDKQIAGLIQEAEKPCIVVLNKWDLVKPETAVAEVRRELVEEIHRDLFFISYAPVLTLSAKTGESIGRLFRTVDRVAKGARKDIGTGVLNRILRTAVEAHLPPIRGNTRLNLLYATQLRPEQPETIPVPRFLLFVNNPKLLTDDYRRYLEAQLRESTPYPGIPIIFNLRARKRKNDQARS